MRASLMLGYRPVEAPPEEAVITVTSSLGLGGLMFESLHPLAEGTLLALDLSLDDNPLRLTGRVIYVRHERERLEIGLEFVGLSDTDREHLTEFYLQHEFHLPSGEDRDV